MQLSEILTQQLINTRLQTPVEENVIAPEKGGVMDDLKSTTSDEGVSKLTDKQRQPEKGGIMDNLKSTTSGAGVGGFSAMGAGYDGLRFAKRGA
jgi:hypothetical protein